MITVYALFARDGTDFVKDEEGNVMLIPYLNKARKIRAIFEVESYLIAEVVPDDTPKSGIQKDVEFVDSFLSGCKDWMNGEEGRNCTESRNRLARIARSATT